MIDFPLTKANRIALARAFAHHPRVDIAIDCIVEDQMGKAYVDQPDTPRVFFVEQSGFFGYLAGDARSDAGQKMAQNLPHGHMYMSPSADWLALMQQAYGDQLITIERYCFTSDRLSAEHLGKLLEGSPFRDTIRRLDVELVQTGTEPVLGIGDFESPGDFVGRGIGFGYVDNGKLVGAAYSSLVSGRGIEVSIFIEDDYRRKGLATALGGALAKWCVERGIEPHWDAANEESCKLAAKLGYIPAGTYQAYYLK
ncbi:MAG: GNAT family N-acetyltransferase [Anaerolineae bacterium]|nr:GNAT family N-acetyltransferase [Anaerolineae bacterium]